MKQIIWRLRFARHMYRRIGGDGWKDWSLCWDAAEISWDEFDGPDCDPIDSADEELSNWTE